MKKTILLTLAPFLLISCSSYKKKEPILPLATKLKTLPDSIRVDDIVIYNAFKNQILAHENGKYDSIMIVDKVYTPHKQLWDNCYGMIFGDNNASKFNNPQGMIEWNRKLYPENKAFFDKRAEILLSINLDSILKKNLKRFNKLVPHKPSAKLSILFTPIQGIGFGGCEADQFALELNNEGYDIVYTIEKGIPHELNHLAYEAHRLKDPIHKTALAQTIDEGFACYFTWVFFDKKIAKEEAVENMSKANWEWYMANEKQLFNSCKKYFSDESGDNPLLNNGRHKLFPDAPKSLNYWIGFRIIEFYVKKHGKNSWKDIYTMPMNDVYHKSGYEEYINSL